MLTLYPDQLEIVEQTRAMMRVSKSILLQSATGSGKTRMAQHMIMAALAKKHPDKRIIFTVPRKDLLEQTSETFKEHGLIHSFIASGKPMNPYADLYIGMVDTMANRIDVDKDGGMTSTLPKASMVIIDEAHFGAGSLDKVIKWYKAQGTWIVGLSATPWKLDGTGLGIWYDKMIEGKSIRWLIDNKRLSDYDYYYGRTKPDLSNLKLSGGDYARGELADFMENQGVIIGDCVRDYRERCMGRLHITRCASIKHSQMVAEQFKNDGIPALHIDGTTEMGERKKIFRAFARREILVLTFADLLNFGFDLSQASGMDVCIESCSDLKPTKSLASIMQFWGRSLRMKPQHAIINDHVNNHYEHGLPCFDRKWTLENRKVKKSSTERAPATRLCPKCYFVHSPSPSCPNCKHVYEIKSRKIEEMDGTMVKADKEALRAQKQAEIKDRKKEQGKAQTLDDLINLARVRKYKNPVAWASRVLAGRMQNRG